MKNGMTIGDRIASDLGQDCGIADMGIDVVGKLSEQDPCRKAAWLDIVEGQSPHRFSQRLLAGVGRCQSVTLQPLTGDPFEFRKECLEHARYRPTPWAVRASPMLARLSASRSQTSYWASICARTSGQWDR